MFGSHLSIAGGMVHALTRARELGLDTVQVFTKNQQQWKAPPLDPGASRDWLTELRALGWEGRTVSHASYLINLASPDDALWRKSIDLMRDEIERCEALSIPFLVHHPGAFTTSSREAGIDRIARAYKELFASTRGYRTVSCLEGTVGSGSNLGGTFEDLRDLRAAILSLTPAPERVGFCLDTCHVHASGVDLATRASARAALKAADELFGLAHVRVLHLNDSMAPMGSHRDRHAHIGAGTIGLGPIHAGAKSHPLNPAPEPDPDLSDTGFAEVLRHPVLAGLPKILETPKDDAAPGMPWDLINLRRLRAAAGLEAIAAPAPNSNLAARAAPMQSAVPKPAPAPVKKVSAKAKRPAASKRTNTVRSTTSGPARAPRRKR
ncbi:MAG: deoxyribonuclease IV [Planctomycetota bacterium]|nr:deoxyribonuclease IV [Planctomycetota bacterium]